MKYVSNEFLTGHAVPEMLKAGWGRIVNVSVSQGTMRRRGFSPYGPSKAALESETIIWAQDLEGTGVTVNALLPGGATRAKSALLDPSIMVPPLLWLVSPEADGMTGRRLVATKWQTDSDVNRPQKRQPDKQAGRATEPSQLASPELPVRSCDGHGPAEERPFWATKRWAAKRFAASTSAEALQCAAAPARHILD
jgi:NAD(P)-dependent dehydrogenase (short-subunit alcohol dehydrogenase family)